MGRRSSWTAARMPTPSCCAEPSASGVGAAYPGSVTEGGAAPAGRSQSAGLVERADQLNELGRHETALQLATRALATDPTDAAAAVAAGVALLNTGRLPEGIDVLRSAVVHHPSDAQLLRLLAFGYTRTGPREWAVRCAARSVELQPWEPMGHCQLSEALLSVGDRAGAVHAAEEAVRLAPQLAKTHLALAEALHPEGARADAQLPRAEEHVRRALQIEPTSAYAHNELARIALARGRRFRAAAHLADAVRSDPRLEAAHANMDVVLGQLIVWAHRGMIGLCVALAVTGFSGVALAGRQPASMPLRVTVSVVAVALVVGSLSWLVRSLRRRVPGNLLRPFVRGFVRRDRLGAAWAGFMGLQWLALLGASLLPPEVVGAAGVVGLHTLWIGAAISWLRYLMRP